MSDRSDKVKEHYSSKNLTAKIESALNKAGKDLDNLELKDIAVIDQLHTGGHLATMDIAKKANLAQGANVLDAGCGIGGSSRLLAKEFKCVVTGIDLVDEFINAAKFLTKQTRLNKSVEFKQGSIMDIPLPGNSFDAILSQHTLMNIKSKDIVFQEFYRVLKPGALLLLHEVVKKNSLPIDLPVPWAKNHDTSFLVNWESLLEICKNTGFELVYYSDNFEKAEKWFEKVKNAAEKSAENPNPLGSHIIFGSQGKKFGTTMTSNIKTNKITIVEAVLKKLNPG